MTTAQEFDLDIDGVKLRCSRTMRGEALPTIIFLHESFGCIRHWRTFPHKLGDAIGMNTLVYDRQGYGQSDPFTITQRTSDYMDKEAEVLNKVIGALGLENVVLFGHSDGGTIALLAAAEFPEHIGAVITEGAHVFVEEITLDGIRAAQEVYESRLKDKLAYYHGGKTEMVFRLWADTWLNEAYRSWNVEHKLVKITCPVLVIQGMNDEYGTIRQVESIENNTAGRSVRCMPAAGHTPHRETPEIVINAVKEFLDEKH